MRIKSTFIAFTLSLGITASSLHAATIPKAASDVAKATKESVTKPVTKAVEKGADATKKAVKPAADAAKAADAKVDKTTAAVKKPSELSDSDKALVEHATKSVSTLTPTQKTSLLTLLNKGDDAALHDLPNVGDSKVVAIKKARPLKSAEDLIMVDGVGESTFDGVIKWTKDGMKPAAAKADTTKKVEKSSATKK